MNDEGGETMSDDTKTEGRVPSIWERMARDWIASAPTDRGLSLRDLAGPIFESWSDEDLRELGMLWQAANAVGRLEGERIVAGDEVRALRIVRGMARGEDEPAPVPYYVVEVLEEQPRLWDEEEIDAAVDGLCAATARRAWLAKWAEDLEAQVARRSPHWEGMPPLADFRAKVGLMSRRGPVDGPPIEVVVELRLVWEAEAE